MPNRDVFHQQVKNALVKDYWRITTTRNGRRLSHGSSR